MQSSESTYSSPLRLVIPQIFDLLHCSPCVPSYPFTYVIRFELSDRGFHFRRTLGIDLLARLGLQFPAHGLPIAPIAIVPKSLVAEPAILFGRCHMS